MSLFRTFVIVSGGSSKLRNTVCQKICFKTEKLALKQMEKINSDPDRTNKFKLKSVYFCPEHKKWHMSSMGKQKAEKINWKKERRDLVVNPDQNMVQKRIEYLEQVPRLRNKFKK